MLYLLFFATLMFTILTLVLADYDYMHPSFLFCVVFLGYEGMCIFNQKEFAITIHVQTVIVIITGLFLFTLTAALSKRFRLRSRTALMQKPEAGLKPIFVNSGLVVALILVQLITIYAWICYLNNLTDAYNALRGESISALSDKINLYDTLTKFWTGTYETLNVPIPMIYRIGNPVSSAGAYLMIYVLVHNFVAEHKINLLHLAVLGLCCVLILLNGSRSPLFRILTMMLILFYALHYKKTRAQKGDRKFLFRMIAIIAAAGVGFFVLLNVMGRNDEASSDIGRYLFIYTGAPIVNLDTYLTTGEIGWNAGLFGAQTFRSLYAYIGKLFNIDSLSYGGIAYFTFSSNGIEIGNVYTTYYKFIYDFGYAGVALILPVACYYIFTYDAVMDGRDKNDPVHFKLFIYSYLFNDLIMSAFSSRFYETALEAPFLKLLLLTWLFDIIIFRQRLHWGRYSIQLMRTRFKLLRRTLRGRT